MVVSWVKLAGAEVLGGCAVRIGEQTAASQRVFRVQPTLEGNRKIVKLLLFKAFWEAKKI